MMEDEERTQRAAYVGVGVAVVAVSFSAILIRWSDADFLAIAAGRMVLSTLLLAPFALIMYRAELFSLERRDVAIMVGIGAVLATHFSLWIASLELTSVASSVVLVTAHPILVGIVGHFFMDERLSRLNAIGIAIGLLGVIILTRGDADAGGDTLLGDLLAFLGGVAAGVYILAGRKTRQRISLPVYAFLVYASCALFLLVAVIVTGTELFTLPADEWWLFLLMALGPSILGHTMYNWTLRYVPASVVSVSLLGEPVGSSILAALLLSEVPPEFTMIGGAVILVGIVMATWGIGSRSSQKLAAVT
ncbi:MAG: DMT family transporter [Thermoplasmata archaeon]|nr:DMT family transporter [Thermoplasmata archaeon]